MSFPQVLESCNEFSPDPSLFLVNLVQISQPFIVGEVLQCSDHLHGPPLDLLHQLHIPPVLEAWAPDEATLGQSRWVNHLLCPDGHFSFDAAQDTFGLLGCKRTLLAHFKLFIHQ